MFSTALVWTYKEENDKLVFITHMESCLMKSSLNYMNVDMHDVLRTSCEMGREILTQFHLAKGHVTTCWLICTLNSCCVQQLRSLYRVWLMTTEHNHRIYVRSRSKWLADMYPPWWIWWQSTKNILWLQINGIPQIWQTLTKLMDHEYKVKIGNRRYVHYMMNIEKNDVWWHWPLTPVISTQEK